MRDIDKPNNDANDRDNFGQSVSKIVELLFQRSRLRNLGCNALVDITNGGRRTSENYYCRGMSSNDRCAREQSIDLILFHCLQIFHCDCIFSNTFALSSENCLIHGKTIALDSN